MRFVVYGAGAVGGVVGARLAQNGHEVVLIARGEHLRAIETMGLRIESPEGAETVHMPAVAHPSALQLGEEDVVLLAVKSQHTSQALRDLAPNAPPGISVVCTQNGVANERAALRVFRNVYGVHVMLPATFLDPGVVQANAAPVTGLLDLGRYPHDADETAHLVAEAFNCSSFDSKVQEHIMRWKHRKLLMNLGNAVEAVFEPSARQDEIDRLAVEEGEACLTAAGIDVASREEDRARRGNLLRVSPVGGRERGGGSTWQSLARETGSSEADYLNGEIVLLGRLHGVATPVNEMLQLFANRLAAQHKPPASVPPEQLLGRLPSR
jgi:2-dehydropantoate 2-reductase